MTMQLPECNIHTKPCPSCYVCGSDGVCTYHGLKDRLFGVPGEWNLKRCVNPYCGTYWLDPMPVEVDLPKFYTNYYTHQDVPRASVRSGLRSRLANLWWRGGSAYLHAQYGYGSAQPSTLDRLLGLLLRLNPAWCANLDFSVFYLPARPGGRLLEVGCGSGGILETMAARGWQVTGQDFDEQAVRNARSKGLTVYHGDLQHQNFEDESFDAIVLSHVIEHVPDPRSLLRECRRILKIGGALVVITPNVSGRLHQVYGKNWLHLDPPRHLILFSARSLDGLAHDVGFKDATVITTVRDIGHLWLASSSIRNRGSYEMGRRASPRDRFCAEVAGLFLGCLHLLDQTKGDELVAVCRKQ